MSNNIFKSKVKSVSNELIISENIGYYLATIKKIDSLKIVGKISGIAIIKTKEISFLDRVLKPFMILKDSTK